MCQAKLLFTTLALIIALSTNCLAQCGNSDDVKVELSAVKKEGKKTYTLNFKISNTGALTVFAAHRSPGYEDLEIEMLQANGKWEILPSHHELPLLTSDPVRVEPGETHGGQVLIDDPYPVSAWTAYPKQPYQIPLTGPIRITVKYFVGESAWKACVSEEYEPKKSTTHGTSAQRAQRCATSNSVELPANSKAQ